MFLKILHAIPHAPGADYMVFYGERVRCVFCWLKGEEVEFNKIPYSHMRAHFFQGDINDEMWNFYVQEFSRRDVRHSAYYRLIERYGLKERNANVA